MSSVTGTYVGRRRRSSQEPASSFCFSDSLGICFLLCKMGVPKLTPSFDSWIKRGEAHYD